MSVKKKPEVPERTTKSSGIRDRLAFTGSYDELLKEYEDRPFHLGAPRVTDYDPNEGEPGTEVTITGYNFGGATVSFGPYAAEVIDRSTRKLVVRVPDDARPGAPLFDRITPRFPDEWRLAGDGGTEMKTGEETNATPRIDRNRELLTRIDRFGSRRLDLVVTNRFGQEVIDRAFDVVLPTPTPDTNYRFAAPENQVVTPSATDQRYLVLLVLPADQSLPAGLTEADMAADLTDKLAGPGKCAGEFWKEASYGKTSFQFDVYDHVIGLDDDWFDYYHKAAPKRIDASGATFPVMFSGTETLELSGGGITVVVTFPSGSQTLSEVITAINDAIEAEATDEGLDEVPFIARTNAGQLRLETTTDGTGATLAVDGGTGLSFLGLDTPTVTEGIDALNDGVAMSIEALEKRVESLTDGEADALLSGYEGLIVSHAVSDGFSYLRAYASGHGWTFNVRGKSYKYGFVHITSGYPWEVFAHEIGHNLGFPDLYDEPGDPELVGRELDLWDIMDAGWHDTHPSAWIKAHKSHRPGSTEVGFDQPWMDPSDVAVMNAPPANATTTETFLLLPSSVEMPAVNPFASSHPGIPLVHAAKLHLQENHDLYVEARERPFSDALLGDAEYDASIPHEGVIVTDAVDDMTGLPVYRAHSTLLTPYSDPLDVSDEMLTEPLTATNSITVECEEVIGSDPAVYKVEVTWGMGDFYDLRIDTWSPPPWESADIWIDTQVDNGWDEYSHSDAVANPDVAGNPVHNGDRSRVGWPSRVYARVWNDGTEAANDVEVEFSVVVPAGSGASHDIGSDTIPSIPPGEFGVAMVEWTPRDHNEGHVCLKATVIHQSDELNASNNFAQENITDWYLESGSPYEPVEFDFQVQNPLPRREHFRVEVDGLRHGYYVDIDPVEFWLDPGETATPTARISADEWMPLDESWQEERMDSPTLSLRFQALYGCSYTPIGGLSSTVHTVRKANFDAGVEIIDDEEAIVFVDATADDAPIRGANVTVRITLKDEDEVVALLRGRTDNRGRASIEFMLPAKYDRHDEYEAEVILSPTLGSGPADTDVSFQFN
ncbi:IPT/TIG domain-containing protein [Haladaptatus sp. NG-WS-4]